MRLLGTGPTADEVLSDLVARRDEVIATARRNSAGKKGAKKVIDKLAQQMEAYAARQAGKPDA